MTTTGDIGNYLERVAPAALAEEWDNVGLLVGDAAASAARVMTCLTVTDAVVKEALTAQADMIVAHHPLPFRAMQRITTETTSGRLLLKLIGAGVAVYSAHTAFDSAAEGINQRLAEGLALSDIGPLAPSSDDATLGAGRIGAIAPQADFVEIAVRLKTFLDIESVQFAGPADRLFSRAAIACGSGASFLEQARDAGCDLFITGEAGFHYCLAAEAYDMGLLLTGHYASERFAVERLAEMLAQEFDNIKAWPSREERDPLRRV